MKKRYTLAALAAILLLQGCAEIVIPEVRKERDQAIVASKAALDAAPVCCGAGFSEFPYEKLEQGDKHKFTVDRGGPAYDFPTGKSFFRAFELPPYTKPYVLQIDSRLSGPSMLVDGNWLFFPELLFLNSDFQVVGAVRDPQYHFDMPFSFEKYGILSRILMDERARAVRYVVVFTEPAHISQSYGYESGGGVMTAGANGSMIIPVSSSHTDIPYNYEGEAGLQIQEPKEKKGGAKKTEKEEE